MFDTLCDAIDAMCARERGFHFTSRNSATTFLDYQQLRQEVHSYARKLNTLDVLRGEPVVIVFPEQAQFIQAFLAVIRAGMVAVPVYSPPLIGSLDDYFTDVERICRLSGAQCILTSDALCNKFRHSCTAARVVTLSELSSTTEKGELPTTRSSDTALIQFTSGSTGMPKGVELLHGNLIANSRAIQHTLAIDPGRDQGVSWLPLHHDMGLIGFLITPILTEGSNWFLPPLEFARRPQMWLELMSKTRATISFAPSFAYDLVTRRVKETEVSTWDLSSWRVAGCGGEPVIAGVLDRFADILQPARFDRSAFVPSYGMAEATVAVTISPMHRGVMTRKLESGQGTERHVVSSGRPVAGTDIRIMSLSGDVLAEGLEGEVQVRGPGVASRILSEAGYRNATCADGWLSTGDLGILSKGELHVCGRIKETVMLNGRNYYPHDIEECVQELDGVRRGSVVAFGRPGTGSEQLVLVAEKKSACDVQLLQRNLRASVRQRLGLSVADVVIVGRGVISRTTSGKLRRSALRASYLSSELGKVGESTEY